MPPSTSGAVEFLHQIYTDLNLTEGYLFAPATVPTDATRERWQAIGDWLNLASRMNADRIFFVADDPVIVFSALPDAATEQDLIRTYRQAWSLARPQCLFVTSPGELRVYDLSIPPPANTRDWQQLPHQVLQRTANVAEELAAFQRSQIESGGLFEQPTIRRSDRRADKQLMNDIDKISGRLRDAGLQASLAHGLIERVILIRYLEDRGVITPDYLEDIAREFNEPPPQADNRQSPVFGASSFFAQCLLNKNLTYQIFRRLAREFNGDLFLVDDDEPLQVDDSHLNLIYRLLVGDTEPFQQSLFLWAYDFSVVPISLISSMYEHFYHATIEDDSDRQGTHYTPPELVEYVLSKILTPEILESEPRVLDPACGSGTFLVEAYRAIVRHETIRTGRTPNAKRLREHLLLRIAGVDLNPEAIRLSAFSLYLAYLNYQSPQDIRKAGPLPRLIYRGSGTVYAPLIIGDFFAPTASEVDETLLGSADPAPALPWPSKAFDVVVGNPPWTSPKDGAEDAAERWAKTKRLPIGDRSPSQLFLWRTLDMLKSDGCAALLVAATVIYNSKSDQFRKAWLGAVTVDEVVNFTQARHMFFANAVAPFCLMRFRMQRDRGGAGHFVYLTVRPSEPLRVTRAMAYGHVDRRLVRQDTVHRRDYLWKVYAWGSHHDEALMERLDQEQPLLGFLPDKKFVGGYGYQLGDEEPNEILKRLPSLRTFEPWGPIDPAWLEDSPTGVKRQPDERLYRGMRLLTRRGVKSGFGPYVRLESSSLTFRHQIYGIPLTGIPVWQAKVLFGTILSALSRYRLFMTSGSWAVWHDSIVSRDLLRLPVRMTSLDDARVVAISNTVDEISTWSPPGMHYARQELEPSDLLRQLDESIFELFNLSRSEVDLIEDWRRFSLNFEAAGAAAISESRRWTAPTRATFSVGGKVELPSPIADYVRVFTDRWSRELGDGVDLSWQVIGSSTSPTIAAIFRAIEAEPEWPSEGFDAGIVDLEQWMAVLARFGENMPSEMGHAIATEGIVRIVGGDYFVIVKRNEQRLWSASAAREDFEATLLSAMTREAA